jgi:hypothetical protein
MGHQVNASQNNSKPVPVHKRELVQVIQGPLAKLFKTNMQEYFVPSTDEGDAQIQRPASEIATSTTAPATGAPAPDILHHKLATRNISCIPIKPA